MQALGTGETVLVKTTKEGMMVGDFTLIFDKNSQLQPKLSDMSAAKYRFT